MVDTLQEALNPFYLVTFLLGFGILRYPVNYPRVRLSILYILSVWNIYAYFFYYVLIFLWSRIRNLIPYLSIIMNLLVTLIIIIMTIREDKKFRILIKKLDQVNDTLQELGTPKEYHKMRNSIKWLMIIWFIIVAIIFSIDSLCTIDMFNDIMSFIISLVVNYSYYINILIDIIIMSSLRYIGTRYDKINHYIRLLSETEECGLRCMWKKSFLITRHFIHNTKNRKSILWTAMHLHSQLYRIARDINSLFEMQMTLQTLRYFFTLTAVFYVEYYVILCFMYIGDAVQWKCFLMSNIVCVVDLIRLILLNYICESVSAKAQKTTCIIHKLTNFVQAREEICQFSLQLLLRPLKFNGMGLFYFGYKFLCKFFVSSLTVIIIIIQMDTSTHHTVSSRNNVTCKEFIKETEV